MSFGPRCWRTVEKVTTGTVAQAAGTFTLGGDLTVNRLGFGAMRLTGKGVWGPPSDHDECVRVLRSGGRLHVVEADRGCRLDDVESFVAEWRMPTVLHSLCVALFRTWVAGRSYEIDEVRDLVEDLPLRDVVIQRLHGTPAFSVDGEKIAAAVSGRS